MKGGRTEATATLYRNGSLIIEGEAIATEWLHGVKARVNVVGIDEAGNVLLSEHFDIPTACGKSDPMCSSRRKGRSNKNISTKIAKKINRLKLHFSER